MTVVITRASDWTWHDFQTFNTVESLFSFVKKEGDVILSENFLYGRKDYEDIAETQEMSLEDAIKLTECEFDVKIYDDYVE